MNKSKRIKDILSKSGYLNELEKHEARFYIEELESQLKQKDNAIDKYTKWLKLNIKIYENRVMEHGFDDDEIIMNCYQNALEKLQQMKGGCDVKN